MKKGNLKKALLALTIAPCVLFAGTGCKKESSEPAPTGLTATQKNEIYSSLKTLTVQKKFIDTTSTAAKLGVNMGMSVDVDLEDSGLKGTAAEDVLKEYGISHGEMSLVDISMIGEAGFIKTENEGYVHFVSEMGGMMLGGSKTKDELTEIVKVSGTGADKKYIGYSKEAEYAWAQNAQTEQMEWQVDEETLSKVASYVSDSHAKNSFTEIFNDDDMNEIMEPALEFIAGQDSYDALVANFDDFANEMLSEYELSSGPVAIPANTTATADLTLTDGVYELKATIDIDDLAIPANELTGQPASVADMDVNLNIKFDSDSVNSINMGIEISEEMSQTTYDALTSGGDEIINDLADEGITITENAEEQIKSTSNLEMSISIDGNATFNNTIMGESVTGYVGGTGVENEFQNREFENTYKIAGTEYETDVYATYGDEIGAFDLSTIGISNATAQLYWDEACTDAIEATEKYNSYDKTIYVKVTPNTGYALVNEIEVDGTDPEDLDTWSCGIYTHEIASGKYQLNYSNYFYDIVKVEVNGVETEYEEGITLEAGKIYNIRIHVVESQEK
ncbi:MAG: hypothetical protein E7356_02355 [Clostridiales bacterium]|nr:hypothetical protein [Clostridiales bacterium]